MKRWFNAVRLLVASAALVFGSALSSRAQVYVATADYGWQCSGDQTQYWNDVVWNGADTKPSANADATWRVTVIYDNEGSRGHGPYSYSFGGGWPNSEQSTRYSGYASFTDNREGGDGVDHAIIIFDSNFPWAWSPYTAHSPKYAAEIDFEDFNGVWHSNFISPPVGSYASIYVLTYNKWRPDEVTLSGPHATVTSWSPSYASDARLMFTQNELSAVVALCQ